MVRRDRHAGRHNLRSRTATRLLVIPQIFRLTDRTLIGGLPRRSQSGVFRTIREASTFYDYNLFSAAHARVHTKLCIDLAAHWHDVAPVIIACTLANTAPKIK
jgi:hypothetical protein